MAEFSKEWCEIHYSEEITPDFSIQEEFSKLELGYSIPFICEGFGFLAIGKTENGACVLAVDAGKNEEGEEMIRWASYEEIVK